MQASVNQGLLPHSVEQPPGERHHHGFKQHDHDNHHHSDKQSHSNHLDIPSSGSQWKLFDMLKISRSPTKKANRASPEASEKKAETDMTVTNCICCSTILSFPQDSTKFKCSICHTTNILTDFATYFQVSDFNGNTLHLISSKYIKKIIDKCFNDNLDNHDVKVHKVFEPLSNYLFNSFKSYHCLNNSFKIKKTSTKIHHSTSNLNYQDIHQSFELLTKLPTKRPLYSALQGCLELLKRTPVSYGDDARNYMWLLILLEIPFLSYALTHYENKSDHNHGNNGGYNHKENMIDVKEIKAQCYDILKRVLGIISNIDSMTVKHYFVSWFSKYHKNNFMSKVDLINVYITFHLKKYFYIANNPDYKRRLPITPPYNNNAIGSTNGNNNGNNNAGNNNAGNNNGNNNASNNNAREYFDQEYFENSNFKEELESMNLISPTSLPLNSINFKNKKKNSTAKIKIYQYGNDWHLKTSSIVLQLFLSAFNVRSDNLQISIFYNSLVDYVNLKMDFDSWISNKKFNESAKDKDKISLTPEISTVLDYINGTRNAYSDSASYFFCKYPFLITLGNKISILEYEAKRAMERKAEEAFINSLDKRIPLDVYFRVKVRRDNIVQDSLNCINANQSNLKKSLKVEFLGEPGIDAGGLKKEWFLLLTKAIFNPNNGILVNVEESNYLWFNLTPLNNNLENYYLFGAILGLAIYNSTILDLNFPIAFYKILLNLPIGFSDFQQLHPVLASNLFKLKNLNDNELNLLDLNFEIELIDLYGNHMFKTMIPNGNNIKVTRNNLNLYIEKYAKFYLMDGIKLQIDNFLKGFKSVTNGNALSLFSPEEIKLLLCGDDEGKLDVESLKSITKYKSKDLPDSNLIKWFWDYLNNLNFTQQRRFLIFVTGSDRIPATGIQNLNFTIKLVGKDCQRLPTSHTCFNELDLYDYSTKEKLIDKLTTAVNESGGFGIK